jgi:uncharacterized protein GlcG (DUF336 family)
VKLELAQALIATARSVGRDLSLKPLSIVVLDDGGQVRAFEREDGASNLRFQIAFGKAHGALAFGMGSRGLMARAEQQPYFIAAATSAIGGALVPVPGGVLVQDEAGNTLGAVGVSGDSSDHDELVAIEAADLVAVTE